MPNIGLIEVMDLAVFPAWLKEELPAVADALAKRSLWTRCPEDYADI